MPKVLGIKMKYLILALAVIAGSTQAQDVEYTYCQNGKGELAASAYIGQRAVPSSTRLILVIIIETVVSIDTCLRHRRAY